MVVGDGDVDIVVSCRGVVDGNIIDNENVLQRRCCGWRIVYMGEMQLWTTRTLQLGRTVVAACVCVHVCGARVCVYVQAWVRACVHVFIQISLFSIVSFNRGLWVLACAGICVLHVCLCAHACVYRPVCARACVCACVHTNIVVF